MAWSISMVKGAFFWTSLAHFLFKPSSITLTNGSVVGDGAPAMECTHNKQFVASSTAAFELLDYPKCCKYKATWQASDESTDTLCFTAHCFHLLKPPRYFLVVLVALDCRMVEERFEASSLSSKSFICFHLPVDRTSRGGRENNWNDNDYTLLIHLAWIPANKTPASG